MKSICGSDCCEKCSRKGDCGGCVETNGRPFGGNCVAANCIQTRGQAAFEELKRTLIVEINALGIEGLRVDDLNLLNGFFVNLEYPLESGAAAKFLADDHVYLGNQIERLGSERCYGVVADGTLLVVCEYGCNGADPELLLFRKKR